MLPPLFSIKQPVDTISSIGKGEFSMTYTEAYKEHIIYTFHGFCKAVIRNAAITAWRDQHKAAACRRPVQVPI